MGNVKGYFGGNFLKAENCKGGELVKILACGEMQTIETGEGKSKEVLNYRVLVNSEEKVFTPNKSNGQILMEAWGENDETWIGKSFKIKIDKILSFGKRIRSIVVEPVEKADIEDEDEEE